MALDIEGIYLRYGTLVHRRCAQLLGNDALAEEVMQDVFVMLLTKRERFEDRGLASLLYQMATHASLNRLRSGRRHPETRDEQLLQDIADADDLEQRSAASALLDRLFGREPASTRVMATLHFVDRMTLEEVAETMGLSVSGVRKRLRGLRERLGKMTEELDGNAA